MDSMASFSPYGHDLRMLNYAPPSTWEPCSPRSLPSQGSMSSPGTVYSSSSCSSYSPMTRSSLPTVCPSGSLSAGSSFQQSPLSAPPSRPKAQVSPLNLPISRGPPPSNTCHLLALPPELLDQILGYVLPYTTPTAKSIAWVRRSVALLATCRTLHEAGARHLYGTNTFELATSFTGTLWRMRWIQPFPGHRAGEPLRIGALHIGAERGAITTTPLQGLAARDERRSTSRPVQAFLGTPYPGETYLPSSSLPMNTQTNRVLITGAFATTGSGSRPVAGLRGSVDANGGNSEPEGVTGPLVPSRPQPFPGSLPARYRALIRFVAVEIRVESEYTGRIKYGFGGPGLADGVRGQVQRLADVLSGASELRRVVVQLVDCDGDSSHEREKERNKIQGLSPHGDAGGLISGLQMSADRDEKSARKGSCENVPGKLPPQIPDAHAQALDSILQPLRALGRQLGCDVALLDKGEELGSWVHGA